MSKFVRAVSPRIGKVWVPVPFVPKVRATQRRDRRVHRASQKSGGVRIFSGDKAANALRSRLALLDKYRIMP
jgi:hypothetical protein